MNMIEAVQSVLRRYADFSGRSRRSEYWWFVLFNVILDIVAIGIDQAIGGPVLQIVVGLGLLVPSLAVGVRRLHDTGRSGWFILIAIIPLVGAIVLLVFFCQDSKPETNQYGPSPKGQIPPSQWGQPTA